MRSLLYVNNSITSMCVVRNGKTCLWSHLSGVSSITACLSALIIVEVYATICEKNCKRLIINYFMCIHVNTHIHTSTCACVHSCMHTCMLVHMHVSTHTQGCSAMSCWLTLLHCCHRYSRRLPWERPTTSRPRSCEPWRTARVATGQSVTGGH